MRGSYLIGVILALLLIIGGVWVVRNRARIFPTLPQVITSPSPFPSASPFASPTPVPSGELASPEPSPSPTPSHSPAAIDAGGFMSEEDAERLLEEDSGFSR